MISNLDWSVAKSLCSGRVLGTVGIGFAVRVQHKIADVVFHFH
jgi:hypothetical protein